MDKKITLCDLQGMLDKFVQAIFGSEVKTRLRPSYFPFTEPSVEVDVSCFECGGKGCPLCKHTGWIEVLGGGVCTPPRSWKTAASTRMSILVSPSVSVSSVSPC